MIDIAASKSFTQDAARSHAASLVTPGEERNPLNPRGYSALTWLNLVCLDAPLVAVSWAWLFAQSFDLSPTAGGVSALFLTSWLIYLADRFGDSFSINPDAATSLRQRFCFRHRPAWVAAVLLIAIGDGVVVCTQLNARQLTAGAAVGTCALVYLLVNRVSPSAWRAMPLKEVSIGFLFAAGTLVNATEGLMTAILPAWLLFACLCSLNCACIAVWERELDAVQKRISLATVFPDIARYALAGLGLVLTVSVGLAVVSADAGRAIYFHVAGSAALLAAVHLAGDNVPRDTRTALADLVLLTPLPTFVALMT